MGKAAIYVALFYLSVITLHNRIYRIRSNARGSIPQNEFLGGVQFKISLKKWTFEQKSGGLFKKYPKNGTFHITWGSIQEWGCNQADTVSLIIVHFGLQN